MRKGGSIFIWLKKETQYREGDLMISFDPPEEAEINDWLLLTTRDRHYKDIAKELRKTAAAYDKAGDYRSKNIALNLAETLTKEAYKAPSVN